MASSLLEKFMSIVESNSGFVYKDEVIDGQRFRTFNYLLVNENSFSCELACELRGCVVNLETGEWFPSIHKFFNDRENKYTSYDWDLSTEFEAREKLDGSLIIPVVVNDKVHFKTRASFSTPQAQMAQSLLNDNCREMILSLYHNGLQPLFELISPENRIVVRYPETKLVLLQIRDRRSGQYLKYDGVKYIAKQFQIPVVGVEHITLSELRKRQKEYKNMEGWVVANFNSEADLRKCFRKFKTDWYFKNHYILTGVCSRYKVIVELILNEKIDDVLSLIEFEEDRRKIVHIQKLVSDYFNQRASECMELFQILQNSNRKDFAIQYRVNENFPIVMRARTESDILKLLKEKILKECRKEEKAKEFINRLEKEQCTNHIQPAALCSGFSGPQL